MQRVQHPHGHHVVGREDRLRQSLADQLPGEVIAAAGRPVARPHHRPVQVMRGDRLLEALTACARVEPVRRPGRVDHRAGAGAGEVLDHQVCAQVLVHPYSLDPRDAWWEGADRDHRGRARHRGHRRHHPLMGGDHEDPVGPRAHELRADLVPPGVLRADGGQQHRVARAPGGGLDRGGGLGGAEQRRAVAQHPDQGGARGLQRPGGAVAGVAQLLDRREHARAGGLAHDLGFVEHPRDGLVGDAGAGGDVRHRGATGAGCHGSTLLRVGCWAGSAVL